MLNDLGIDLPEALSAPAATNAQSTVSAYRADRPPTSKVSVASVPDVLETSLASQSVTYKGGYASQRSPAPRPGFDASQRNVPGRQIANRSPEFGLPLTHNLGDASLRTPAGISGYNWGAVATPVATTHASAASCAGTSTPLSIVSTCPPSRNSHTPCHDASTRSPGACPVSACVQMQSQPVEEQGDAVKCWLTGVGSVQALCGDALVKQLHSAAPEMYED